MKTLQIALSVEENGRPIEGSPFIRRITVDESQSFEVEQASGGGYLTLPITSLDQVNALLLRADQTITVRLAGQTTGGLTLNAGALLLILDSAIAATASTNVTVDNSSGTTAILKGLVGGT